jgi:hypothetical protein
VLRPIIDALTRRRLGGAVLLLAGVAVALAVIVPALSGDDEDGARSAGPAVRVASVPSLGLAFAYPRSWDTRADGRVLRSRSPEGSAILTLASPVSGRQSPRVEAALVQTLRSRYAPARVLRRGLGRLGGRRARSVELSGRAQGRPVRALTLVTSTQYRTYAVTLLTSARPSRRRLTQVAGILRTLRLSKPVRPRRR